MRATPEFPFVSRMRMGPTTPNLLVLMLVLLTVSASSDAQTKKKAPGKKSPPPGKSEEAEGKTNADSKSCEPRDHPYAHANEYSCDRYRLCVSGVTYHATCPQGLHFNVKRQICDAPESAKCNLKKNSTVTVSGNLSSSVEGLCLNLSETRFRRHPINCRLFYQCQQGVQYVYECPPLLQFNEIRQTCDVVFEEKCDDDLAHGGGSDAFDQSLLAAVRSFHEQIRAERQTTSSLLTALIRDLRSFASQAIGERASSIFSQIGKGLQDRIDATHYFLDRLNSTLHGVQ